MPAGILEAAVCGCVIDEDDLVVAEVLLQDGIQAGIQVLEAVVVYDYHGDLHGHRDII